MRKTGLFILLVILGSAVFATTAMAENSVELSLRADVRIGTGKPSNDIPGGGVVFRYQMSKPGWWIGGTLDTSPLYDIELPLSFFGLDGGEVDSQASSTMVSVFAERRYGGDNLGWQPFWNVGLGINSIDVEDLTGELNNGNPYRVQIDAGEEFVVEIAGGFRYRFSNSWSTSASALLQHRIADWTVTETETGQSRKIDDYAVHGLYLSLDYRF